MPRAGKIYVARETIHLDNGVTIKRGERVREGHPFLRGREMFFDALDVDVHYEVEQATAAPGEKRGDPLRASAKTMRPEPVEDAE